MRFKFNKWLLNLSVILLPCQLFSIPAFPGAEGGGAESVGGRGGRIIEVTNIKYPAIVYIDDRCVQFKGTFKQLIDDLKKFEVYWYDKPKKYFDELGKNL